MKTAVIQSDQPEMTENATPARLDDVITIMEMSRRLKVNTERAYQIAARPGFPLLNLTGGERGNRVIWGDALNYIREHFRVGS